MRHALTCIDLGESVVYFAYDVQLVLQFFVRRVVIRQCVDEIVEMFFDRHIYDYSVVVTVDTTVVYAQTPRHRSGHLLERSGVLLSRVLF